MKERHTEKDKAKNREATNNQPAHHGWHEDDMSARYTDTFSDSS